MGATGKMVANKDFCFVQSAIASPSQRVQSKEEGLILRCFQVIALCEASHRIGAKRGEKRQAGGIAGSCRQVAVPAFGVLPPHLRTNPIGMLPARAKQVG